MLEKSRISQIDMAKKDKDGLSIGISDEWQQARCGRFTSSNIWKLCGEKGFGETGMSYIRTRVFEAISKVSSEQDIFSSAIAHGLVEEGAALQAFGRDMNLKSIVVQKLIYGKQERTSTTPDALVIRKESTDSLSWDASIVECKALQPASHIEMVQCETPADVKKAKREHYFQVLDQLEVCDCLDGYLVYYHPSMPLDRGGYRKIHFRKVEVREDLKLLNERKLMALKEFDRIYKKLTNP